MSRDLERFRKMNQKSVSIVIPAFNEELGILEFLYELKLMIENLTSFCWEVIVIDDGSTDATSELLTRNSPLKIKLVKLSKNFGHQAALEAGYSAASGDYIVTMDSDFQHPISKIPYMLKIAIEGSYDIVQGVRETKNSENKYRKLASKIAYRTISVFNSKATRHAGDYRLITKRLLQLILQYQETNKAHRFLIQEFGFRTHFFTFVSENRRYGKSNYSVRESFRIFQKGLLSYSATPLLGILWTGVITFIFFILYTCVIFAQRFKGAEVIPGWTSTMLVILIFSSLQMISIATLGYYIYLILGIVRRKPGYLVDYMINVEPHEQP